MKRFTVRAARERMDPPITQEELARRIGVRQNRISALETGKVANPGIAIVLDLAAALGVEPQQLVFGPEAQEAAQ